MEISPDLCQSAIDTRRAHRGVLMKSGYCMICKRSIRPGPEMWMKKRKKKKKSFTRSLAAAAGGGSATW